MQSTIRRVKPRGYVLWEGPSRIDGQPVVAIATTTTDNRKTGDLVQTWILRRDLPPVQAILTGEDRSICGACPHRGVADGRTVKGRSCYVNVGQAPNQVYRAYQRGAYPRLGRLWFPALAAGRKLRFGAYGDPTAVPLAIWSGLAAGSEGWTGYTHGWRDRRNAGYRAYLMASCDSERDRTVARLLGWRSFRVRRPDDHLLPGEFTCPASAEANARLTCSACMACDGVTQGRANTQADVSIVAHGGGILGASTVNRVLDALAG